MTIEASETTAKKWTLGDLLAEMSRIERLVEDADLSDPSELVGLTLPSTPEQAEKERAEVLEKLRLKVDAIDYVIREFHAYAERTGERAKQLATRAASASKKAGALEAYMLTMMEQWGFSRLPGEERTVEIRKSTNPKLVIKRPPNEHDAMLLSELVTEVPLHWEWKNDAVKTALKSKTLEFAELQYRPRLHFDDRDRPQIADRKKGKK